MVQNLAFNAMKYGLVSYVLSSLAFAIWFYISSKDRDLLLSLFTNENAKDKRLTPGQSFLLRIVRISRFTIIAGGVVLAGIMLLQLAVR